MPGIALLLRTLYLVYLPIAVDLFIDYSWLDTIACPLPATDCLPQIPGCIVKPCQYGPDGTCLPVAGTHLQAGTRWYTGGARNDAWKYLRHPARLLLPAAYLTAYCISHSLPAYRYGLRWMPLPLPLPTLLQ